MSNSGRGIGRSIKVHAKESPMWDFILPISNPVSALDRLKISLLLSNIKR